MAASRLRLGVTRQRGLTMVEVMVVLVILALLGLLAWQLAFAGHVDRAHDSRAQQNLAIAVKDLRSQYVMHDRSYPSGNDGEEVLSERLHRSNPQFNFHGYEEGERPAQDDHDFSVTIEDAKMASLCAKSRTGTAFCARSDEAAELKPSASEFVIAEASDTTLSWCAAPSEEEARECLASRDPFDDGEPADEPGEDDGGEDPGQGGPADPIEYILDVMVAGNGQGRVVGPGIDCPGDCTESYPAGAEVELRRQSLGGSSFLGWSEDCSGKQQRCTVVMDADRYVTASFLGPDVYEQSFAAGDVISDGWLDLSSNAKITGDVHANGNVTMSSNAEICGRLTHGGSFSKQGNARHNCGPRLQGTVALPPVDQGTVPMVNDNGQLQGGAWDPASRTLQLGSNKSYVIPAGVYSFCRISLSSNSRIYVERGDEVTIFFDTPENCGLASGAVQLTFNSNSMIDNTDSAMTSDGFDPRTKLRLLFTGSPFRPTQIRLNSNTMLPASCVLDLDIYAPHTDVVMNSNATYCGRLAAKTVDVSSNARLQAP